MLKLRPVIVLKKWKKLCLESVHTKEFLLCILGVLVFVMFWFWVFWGFLSVKSPTYSPVTNGCSIENNEGLFTQSYSESLASCSS